MGRIRGCNQVEEWIGSQSNTQWVRLPNNIYGPAMDFAATNSKIEVCFFVDSDTETKMGGFRMHLGALGIR